MTQSVRNRSQTAVAIKAEFGWRHVQNTGIEIWTKGYGDVEDTQSLVSMLGRLGDRPTAATVSKLLLGMGGHFALIARTTHWTLAAVDRVRSIPLAFAKVDDDWRIDDQAERLRNSAKISTVDLDAALQIAMAGYTIDTATVYRGLHQLGPGEFAVFGSGPPERHRYYTYRPWRSDKPTYNPARAMKALGETTLAIIDTMMKGIGDRILVVPLSAGRDSRLIVSAAQHLGYDNVKTFAYGRRGNHEARASRAIAERLGYDWNFVPTDTGFMKKFYASENWPGYCRFADSLQSVPFVQDLPQILALKRDGYIPDDAVLCNGNSGDYISGAHIVPPMDKVVTGLSPEERMERITSTLLAKHFALWRELCSERNRSRVRQALVRSIERSVPPLADAADDYGVYEYAEFQDRQCKYVITGQRIYEFLGHDWRLPLWDNAYLDFFETVPLDGKVGQTLYARMLDEENWGKVWQGLPVNRKTIKPGWIRPLRWVAKAMHAPLGRARWHRFEKRYFNYWMEQGSQSAIRSYGDIVRDNRGARHGIAWLAEDYLARHSCPLTSPTPNG